MKLELNQEPKRKIGATEFHFRISNLYTISSLTRLLVINVNHGCWQLIKGAFDLAYFDRKVIFLNN